MFNFSASCAQQTQLKRSYELNTFTGETESPDTHFNCKQKQLKVYTLFIYCFIAPK